MSTLRISNIEAKSVPASATIDEKVKITNSSGDTLVFIDGKTSGITTVGINTTDSNITFDANSNVVVTGIITATKFSGQFEPTSVGIADSIFHTGDDNTSIRFPAADTITAETGGSERLRIDSSGSIGINTSNPRQKFHLDNGTMFIRGDTAPAIRINAAINDTSSTRLMLGLATGANNFFNNAAALDACLVAPSTGRLLFGVGTSARMYIVNSGDITINRPSQLGNAKLSLQCDPAQEGIAVNLNQNSGISTAFAIFNNTGSEVFNLAQDTDSTPDLIFKIKGSAESAPVEKLRITSNGDVRVGGGSPTTFGSGTTVNETYNTSTYTANLVTSGTHILQMIASQTHGVTSIGTRSNHNLNLCANDLTKATITTTGDLSIANGNLVIGTSGKGIDFSDTADGTGSNQVEILDDYEEGSWTATMTGGNTITTNAAYYTKIGRMVYWMLHCTPTFAQNNTTDYQIYGLPFTSANVSQNYGWSGNITYTQNGNNSTLANMRPLVQMNDSYIYFHTVGLGDSSRIKNNFIRSTMLNQHFLLGGFYMAAY